MLSKAKIAEIVKKYGKDEKDTGSVEVQIALLTEQINELTKHLKKNKKDVVLFVKNSNSTAINVYTNCGYTPFGDYKIIYY